jgi:GMP reductase
MNRSLNYKDIHLIPNYSTLSSRADADVSITLKPNFTFKLPVVPSNMVACVSFERAEWLARNGYFYILHRFYNYDEILDWMREDKVPYVSISLGIQDRDYEFINTVRKEGLSLDFVTVDVAHGNHERVMLMLDTLLEYKTVYNPELFIIGGNIATREAYIRMSKYVDAAKVGIACGASCITYNKTGFASPMFSSVRDIAEAKSYLDKAPLIIADGGISSNGDIAKAFVAGADMVMCGSLFARCIDSPAVIDPADPTKKLYFGSASLMNGNKKNIEGKTVSLTINGMTYKEKLIEIQQDLASAVSYAGGNDLTAFKEVNWAQF